TAVSGATAYNSYRGTIPATGGLNYKHACYQPNPATPTVTDGSTPATTNYYLIAAKNVQGGEGPPGDRSKGTHRPNNSPRPCPASRRSPAAPFARPPGSARPGPGRPCAAPRARRGPSGPEARRSPRRAIRRLPRPRESGGARAPRGFRSDR